MRESTPPRPTLAHTLSTLPKKPGVYQYYDASGKILYVGKAKVLKNRVQSYFTLTATKHQNSPIPSPNCSPRIALMVRQIARIETIVVESESDALILENSFIKQLKPKYNVLLRDDKTYPYIAFDMGLDFPVPIITRAIKSAKHMLYFGPYPSGCRELVDSLLELFALVQRAPSCVAKGRACLFYQINRCKAPCEHKITKEAYKEIVDSAISALKSPSLLLKLLKQKMHTLAQNLQFEEAGIYRDRIKKLSHLQTLCVLDLAKHVSFDIVYFYMPESSEADSGVCIDSASSLDSGDCIKAREKSQGLLLWLFIREGKIVSYTHEIVRIQQSTSDKQSPSDELATDSELGEIYSQALINRYTKPLPLIPESIVIGDMSCITQEQLNSLRELLSHTQGRKIPLQSLSKGRHAKFLPIVRENAKLLLAQARQEHAQDSRILARLQELLGLENLPDTIEVFDTSHHSGENCVGGMVVYAQGEFAKNRYRRYKLESRDEYGQMREMLTRRALSFDKESPPDLWLIDGGRAQIALAKEILESSGVYVDVIALAKEKRDAKAYRAKGKARDVIYTSTEIFRLESSDVRLQFLQKLRDSVHHYAISYHRRSKTNALTQKNLLKEKGLSDGQIARALAFVGGFEALQDKSKQEILELIRQNKRP